MNVTFFGNTRYSLIGAKIIHDALLLSCIVTLPDRPNKKGVLTPSPLKSFAHAENIPVLTANSLDDTTYNQLATRTPDFFIVEDYGLFLPEKYLNLPKYASLNIHHSLLPRYRGPSPAPSALLAGDSTSGVTIIQMVKEVDAGPIYTQKEYGLKTDETTNSLLTVLNTLGAKLLLEVVNNFEERTPHKQEERKATFTKRLTKQDGYFDIDNPPAPDKLDRMIRAYYPWPTAWTRVRITNHESRIMKFLPDGKVQLEGGKSMSVKDFLNGFPQMRGQLEKILNPKH